MRDSPARTAAKMPSTSFSSHEGKLPSLFLLVVSLDHLEFKNVVSISTGKKKAKKATLLPTATICIFSSAGKIR